MLPGVTRLNNLQGYSIVEHITWNYAVIRSSGLQNAISSERFFYYYLCGKT